MKNLVLLMLCALSVATSCASCDKNARENQTIAVGNLEEDTMTRKMKIIVGGRSFTATLYDNNSTVSLMAQLPLTVDMTELNGNEKYVDLPSRLPTNASNPQNIRAGDIMLYGSSTLVLFYKDFATSYSYTPLGRINDAAGLGAALGTGNVRVTFEME
jgi:hypothetical protein